MTPEEKLNSQFEYLKFLKTRTEKQLRKHHGKIFAGTRYDFSIPSWMHRTVLEKRLFYYYCVRNYHYDRTTEVAKEFRRKVKALLQVNHAMEQTAEKITIQELKNSEYFTATNIKAMSIADVDRFLAGLNIYVEAPEKQRRKILWEWFHRPTEQLVEHFNAKGSVVPARHKGEHNNKYSLSELILQFPTLTYSEFQRQFGRQMPTVTRKSFQTSRCRLRKAGYDIPQQRRGPENPVVVVGLYGHTKKARVLNSLPLQDTTDGEEES